MCLKCLASCFSTNVQAVPAFPARAVRPTRCTYFRISTGASYEMTWETLGRSIPWQSSLNRSGCQGEEQKWSVAPTHTNTQTLSIRGGGSHMSISPRANSANRRFRALTSNVPEYDFATSRFAPPCTPPQRTREAAITARLNRRIW